MLILWIQTESKAQIAISNTTPITQNFDAMGSGTSLPASWRMHRSATPVFSSGSTTVGAQASSGSPTAGNSYNWGSTASERAVGVMTSGSYASPSSLMAHFQNTNASALSELTVSYTCERYRRNSASASVQFFYSLNGSTWTAVSAGDVASSSLPTGTSAYGFNPPNLTVNVNAFTITGLNIANGGSIYLRWNLNTTGSNSQGIGIDNVSITASFTGPCSAPTTQASNLTASSVTDVSASINWTNGNGSGRIVVINTTNSFSNPADGFNPTANTTYSGGEQIVFNGTGSGPLSITGLNPGTTYFVRVYEYCSPDRIYNSSTESNNPTSFSTTAPVPTLIVGTLTGFGAQCIGNTFGPESFSINGTSLSNSPVTVSALAGYTFATVSGGPYQSSLSISQPGGTFSQTIYVRFTPTAVQSYNGNIVVGGGGATSQNVSVSGSGINTTASVISGSASSITYNSGTIAGSISNTGCSSISAYGIEYSIISGFTPGGGIQVASMNLSAGNFTAELTGLLANTTYYYRAYATNAGGTEYGLQQSFSTNQLDAPLAIAGSSVGDFGFVANWDPVPGATGYRLDVSTTPFIGSLATDLIISEYVEGSASNKYIEIFNGTGAAVNLADYRLRLFANGASSPSNDVLLSGSLPNNSTIVYRNTSATIYGGSSTINAAVNFNGDDAIALYKISTSSYVDIIGVIGNDPGTQWVLGGNSTLDQTLVRNASVSSGVSVNPTGTGSGAFLTLSTEWTEFAIDNVSNLGSHTFNAGGPTYVPGYQDLAVSGTSQTVSGLNPNTTYYYRVRATSATSTSANSNTIDVTTTFISCGSGVSIGSFSPASGPAGTHVRITGTGFSGATSVTFNGQDAESFTILSNTEIDAIVPVGADVGLVRVADAGGCFGNSSSNFNFLNIQGTCTGVLSDLILSEIYDPESGNIHYIEIFNGTGNTIDLNGSNDYSIRLLNKSSSTDPSPTTYNLDITGDILQNEVKVYYAGQIGSLVTSPAQGFAVGFNDFDEIQLLKNGSIIDRVQGPNNIGYNYRRLTTVTGPNTSYTAAEWAIVTTGEVTTDIGLYAVNTNFEITSNPSDQAGELCDVFTLNVASSNPGVTYQWYQLNSSGIWQALTAQPQISGTTTSTLQINPLNGFDDSQFYCLISQATCQKLSHAAQIQELPNTRSFFRSAGSGNWNTPGVWEFASSLAGPWTTACTWPTAINSGNVRITNGNTITVSGQDILIDQLTVESGAHLILSSTDAITLSNGTGVDFTLEGTFTDNANSGGGNGVFANSGATWQLGLSGTLIKTNTASFAVYRDNYEGGMNNIPASGTVIIRSVSGSNPAFTAVGNTFYPNLIFESTSGLWNPVTVGSRFNGASDFPTIKGNLDVGGSGAGSVIIYNQNTNATPVTVLGDVIIRNGNTLTNNGSSTGTGFDIRGNLTVNGTFTVLSSGTGQYLRLSGASQQTLAGSGTLNVQNLQINNTSLSGIELQRDLRVNNELRMIAGNILTGTNLLELGSNTTNRGSLNHTSGYVVGRMRRWFSGTNTGISTGLFPMGQFNGNYLDRSVQLEYTTAPNVGGHLTVEFIEQPMANVNSGLPILAANTGGASFDVEYVEDEGYWQIDNQTGTLTDGLYTLKLTGEEFQTVSDVTSLTLLKRVSGGPWICQGNHETASGPVNKPVVERSGMSGFSNFGFGSGPNNPLPIELLNFSATALPDHVLLNWATASETNNAWFEVERSHNLADWNLVCRQPGAGNSNSVLSYADKDLQPVQGISYYRLKQTDFDGSESLSNPVAVNYNTSGSNWQVSAFIPQGELTQIFLDRPVQNLSLEVFDASGRRIESHEFNGKQTTLQLNLNYLSTGVFWIRLRTHEKFEVLKFVR